MFELPKNGGSREVIEITAPVLNARVKLPQKFESFLHESGKKKPVQDHFEVVGGKMRLFKIKQDSPGGDLWFYDEFPLEIGCYVLRINESYLSIYKDLDLLLKVGSEDVLVSYCLEAPNNIDGIIVQGKLWLKRDLFGPQFEKLTTDVYKQLICSELNIGTDFWLSTEIEVIETEGGTSNNFLERVEAGVASSFDWYLVEYSYVLNGRSFREETILPFFPGICYEKLRLEKEIKDSGLIDGGYLSRLDIVSCIPISESKYYLKHD